LKKINNYNSSLYDFLNTIEDKFIYHKEHNLRHPLAIYNLAIGKLEKDLEEVINLLNSEKNDELREKYIEFLEAIDEFVDDMYNIIKCFYPKKLGKDNISFAYKWLINVDKVGIDKYWISIKDWIEGLKKIVNKIKHEHGRTAGVTIKCNFYKIKGFFLEAYDGNTDTLIPDKNVHADFRGMRTAYSYNRDCAFRIASIYFVAEETYKYLQKLTMVNSKIIYNQEQNENKFFLLIQKFSNRPKILFPDEYCKDLAKIIVENEMIKIEYPAGKDWVENFIKCEPPYKGELVTGGDGHTRSFGIPYL
jgi:hypothetical protein